jgi:hypothetical protein
MVLAGISNKTEYPIKKELNNVYANLVSTYIASGNGEFDRVSLK